MKLRISILLNFILLLPVIAQKQTAYFEDSVKIDYEIISTTPETMHKLNISVLLFDGSEVSMNFLNLSYYQPNIFMVNLDFISPDRMGADGIIYLGSFDKTIKKGIALRSTANKRYITNPSITKKRLLGPHLGYNYIEGVHEIAIGAGFSMVKHISYAVPGMIKKYIYKPSSQLNIYSDLLYYPNPIPVEEGSYEYFQSTLGMRLYLEGNRSKSGPSNHLTFGWMYRLGVETNMIRYSFIYGIGAFIGIL